MLRNKDQSISDLNLYLGTYFQLSRASNYTAALHNSHWQGNDQKLNKKLVIIFAIIIITQYQKFDLSKSQNLDLRLAQHKRQPHNDSKSAYPENDKLGTICYVTEFLDFQ